MTVLPAFNFKGSGSVTVWNVPQSLVLVTVPVMLLATVPATPGGRKGLAVRAKTVPALSGGQA